MGMQPRGKPGDSDGKTKSYVTGSPEDNNSNKGGSKGAKIIGTATDGSAGKLKTYKTKVMDLNTGSLDGSNRGLGNKDGLQDRNDA